MGTDVADKRFVSDHWLSEPALSGDRLREDPKAG